MDGRKIIIDESYPQDSVHYRFFIYMDAEGTWFLKTL